MTIAAQGTAQANGQSGKPIVEKPYSCPVCAQPCRSIQSVQNCLRTHEPARSVCVMPSCNETATVTDDAGRSFCKPCFIVVAQEPAPATEPETASEPEPEPAPVQASEPEPAPVRAPVSLPTCDNGSCGTTVRLVKVGNKRYCHPCLARMTGDNDDETAAAAPVTAPVQEPAPETQPARRPAADRWAKRFNRIDNRFADRLHQKAVFAGSRLAKVDDGAAPETVAGARKYAKKRGVVCVAALGEKYSLIGRTGAVESTHHVETLADWHLLVESARELLGARAPETTAKPEPAPEPETPADTAPEPETSTKPEPEPAGQDAVAAVAADTADATAQAIATVQDADLPHVESALIDAMGAMSDGVRALAAIVQARLTA